MIKWLKEKLTYKTCDCESGERTLHDVPIGKSVVIDCLRGEPGTCQRLREMGFCESSVVQKIADSGALICKVCEAKVIISKKLANNIIVRDICAKDKMTNADAKIILLSQMSIGERATIHDFVYESDDCERVEEMGITPGETIEIVRYAPLGDPIEVKIRGYLLSLRKDEADLIKVRLDS